MPQTLSEEFILVNTTSIGQLKVAGKMNVNFNRQLICDLLNALIQTKYFRNSIKATINPDDQEIYLNIMLDVPPMLSNSSVRKWGEELLQTDVEHLYQSRNSSLNQQPFLEERFLLFKQQGTERNATEQAKHSSLTGENPKPPKASKPSKTYLSSEKDSMVATQNWPWANNGYEGYINGISILPPSNKTPKALLIALFHLRKLNEKKLIFSTHKGGVFAHNNDTNANAVLQILNEWLASIGQPSITLAQKHNTKFKKMESTSNAIQPDIIEIKEPDIWGETSSDQLDWLDEPILELSPEIVEFYTQNPNEKSTNSNNNNNTQAPPGPLTKKTKRTLFVDFDWHSSVYFEFTNGIFIIPKETLSPKALELKLQKLKKDHGGKNILLTFQLCENGVFVRPYEQIRKQLDTGIIETKERFNSLLKKVSEREINFQHNYNIPFVREWGTMSKLVDRTLPPTPENIVEPMSATPNKRQKT